MRTLVFFLSSLMFVGPLLAGFSEALDTSNLTFTTGGDAPWVIQSAVVSQGTEAVRSGTVGDEGASWLETKVTGYGMLNFQWKCSSESRSNGDRVELTIDGVIKEKLDDHARWEDESITILGSGTHVVRWTYRKDDNGSGGQDCAWLDAVSWTPAPSSITVTFDSCGGSAVTPKVYSRGAVFSSLPIPSRSGWTFLGWSYDTVLGKPVLTNQTVPLWDTTLVARWGRPVSILPEKAFSAFKMGGDSFWREISDAAVDLETELAAMYSYTNYSVKASSGTFQVTTTQAGYLSFDWMVCRGSTVNNEYSGGYVELTFYIDGEEQEYLSAWGNEDSEETIYIYLPKGKHVLRWAAVGRPSYSQTRLTSSGTYYYSRTFGTKPIARVSNLKFEVDGAQPDFPAWSQKLNRYHSWRTGDIKRFVATYGRRILSNPTDYEARVFRALSTMALLAENAEFQKYAKTFGVSFDFAQLSWKGRGKMDAKSTPVNTLTDRTLAIAAPSIKRALADLEGIPADWKGTVRLSTDVWPLNEDVDLDISDILYCRAYLESQLALLNYVAAYDLTLNWAKLSKLRGKRARALPSAKTIPLLEDMVGWKKNGAGFIGDGGEKGLNAAWGVQCGSKIAFELENAHDWDPVVQVDKIDFALKSSKGEKVHFDVSITGGGKDSLGRQWNYSTVTNVSCTAHPGYPRKWTKKLPASVMIRGNRLRLIVNCATIKGFSSAKWFMDSKGRVRSGTWGEVGSCGWGFTNVEEGEWDDQGLGTSILQFWREQSECFSKVRNASRLEISRNYVERALRHVLKADEMALARPTDNLMHLFEYESHYEDRLEIMRTNARRALEALTEPQKVDMSEFIDDYQLLPDNGFLCVYLGALFEGRLTRDQLPKPRVDEYGRFVPDFYTISDPTFRGLIPNMGIESVTNMVANHRYSNAVDYAEWIPESDCAVPGTHVVRTFSNLIGYTVTGLPKGWTWNKTTGVLTGLAATTVTLKFSRPLRKTETVTVKMAPLPSLLAFAEDSSSVSVKGTGRYAAGASVSVVAAVKAGYAFAGWYSREDGKLFTTGTRYSFKMPAHDVSLEARTIPLENDCLHLMAKIHDVVLAVNEPVQIDPEHYFAYESGSAVSLSAKGLPSGVSLNWNEEAQCYGLSGRPKKAGVYIATLNAKNAGQFRGSCVLRFWVGREPTSESMATGINLKELYCDRLKTGETYSEIFEIPFSLATASPVKGITTTGLPTGLKAVLENGRMKLSGVPTKAGLFPFKVNVTYIDGTTACSTQTVFVEDSGCCYVPLVVIDNDPSGTVRGTVTGGGVKPYGATVQFEAKSTNAKSYFFAGWFLDEDATLTTTAELSTGDWRKGNLKFVLTHEIWNGMSFYARFVTKTEDEITIVGATNHWRVLDEATGLGTVFPVTVSSPSLPLLTAKGLPKGTALSGGRLVVTKQAELVPGTHHVTLTAKNLSGNSATMKVDVVVPNLKDAVIRGKLVLDTSDIGYSYDEYEFLQAGVAESFTLSDLGIEVADGWNLSVTGLPSGWVFRNGRIYGTAVKTGNSTVMFVVTKGSVSYRATATFRLAALPSWVVGEHVGAVLTTLGKPGTISVKVTSGGVISGSYVLMGTKVALSGSGFQYDEATGAYIAKVLGKVSGKTKSFRLAIHPREVSIGAGVDTEVGEAEFLGALSSSEEIDSVRFNQNVLARSISGVPELPSGLTTTFNWYGNGFGNTTGAMTIKTGAQGSFTCSFKTKAGTVTGTAQLSDFSYREEDSTWVGYLVIGIPPNSGKKIPGCYCIVALVLTPNAQSDRILTVSAHDVDGTLRVWKYEDER